MLQTINLPHHLNELAEKKWTILELPKTFSLALQSQAICRLQEGLFRPAELAQAKKVVAEVRNDQILWLDAQKIKFTETEDLLFKNLETLKNEIRNDFRIGLTEFECHYAFYDKGHYYQRHLDSTQDNNKRFFSFVIYLNSDWNKNDGGELVGYENEKIIFQQQPELGKMVLFQSDLPHEVRTTQRARLSLTGWFRK